MNNKINTDVVYMKCGNCSLPLSIFPIYYNEKTGNVCGRCKDEVLDKYSELIFVRQPGFEDLLKNLVFICPNKKGGCKTEIQQINAANHEAICSYTRELIFCPLWVMKCNIQCKWSGESIYLPEHLRNTHRSFFKRPEFIITMEYSSELVLFDYESSLLVFFCNYLKKLDAYEFYVLSEMDYKTCQEHRYAVIIESGETSETFEGKNLDYMLDNFGLAPDNALILNSYTVKRFFKYSDKITVKFTIEKVTHDDLKMSQNKRNKATLETKIFMEVLAELKCPVCFNWMGAPIYICSIGHNMCFKCTKKFKKCQSGRSILETTLICNSIMEGRRNRSLERFSKIRLRCMNTANGCQFISPIASLKSHENSCPHARRNCIFTRCEWIGLTFELFEHLSENHDIFQLDVVYMQKLERIQEFMFCFEENIFLLFFKYKKSEYFYFTVQCLGGKNLGYTFEFEVINELDEFALNGICQPLSINYNRRDLEFIRVESIKKFIVEDHLAFRLRIARICD